MNGAFSARCEALQMLKKQLLLAGCVVAALGGFPLVTPATAQTQTAKVTTEKIVSVTPVKEFGGLGWGIGIAANFDIRGSRNQLSSAEVVNGIVRVTDTSGNASVSFVLEAHYFLKDYFLPFVDKDACKKNYPGSPINCTEFAHGPFVAIEVGGGAKSAVGANDPISGYALGWMFGMRHPNSPTPNSSWNIGAGLRISPKGAVLGDGFVANQPPPAGETSIRYKTEPRLGVMLLSTFSF